MVLRGLFEAWFGGRLYEVLAKFFLRTVAKVD